MTAPASDLAEPASRVGAALADADLGGHRDLLDPGSPWQVLAVGDGRIVDMRGSDDLAGATGRRP